MGHVISVKTDLFGDSQSKIPRTPVACDGEERGKKATDRIWAPPITPVCFPFRRKVSGGFPPSPHGGAIPAVLLARSLEPRAKSPVTEYPRGARRGAASFPVWRVWAPDYWFWEGADFYTPGIWK
ncbi:hypothetical protein NL676_011390 [Syzygium grande]|nr:hypothetical protein NL676_011390 [Syzygium grande]